MLKGDLRTTPLAPLLLHLAEGSATGCLHIADPDGYDAQIFFKNGFVYAVNVPGRRPQLGAKLVSSGALSPEALADALEAQATELQGWRLGELLVHLGYVDQPVVEAFVKEQVNDALWDLLRWTDGDWRFRRNERTREDVAPPMSVEQLLTELRDRGMDWAAISEVMHGPDAVPVLSANDHAKDETVLDSDAWSMLCKIDGQRTLAELARDGGYTVFEAGQVLVRLVQAGLVDIEEDVAIGVPGSDSESGEHRDAASGLGYGAAKLAAALAAEQAGRSSEESEEFEPSDDEDDHTDALTRLVQMVGEVSSALTGHIGVAEADRSESGSDPRVPDAPAAAARAAAAEIALQEPDGTADGGLSLAPAAALGSQPAIPNPWASPPPDDRTIAPDLTLTRSHREHESFADSLARVSSALSDVLGATPAGSLLVSADATARVDVAQYAVPDEDEIARSARIRALAAAELAAAQSEANELRTDGTLRQIRSTLSAAAAGFAAAHVIEEPAAPADDADIDVQPDAGADAIGDVADAAGVPDVEQPAPERDADVVDLDAHRREQERLEAERREAERLEAERREAERLEAERLEAERREYERLEQERLEAERLEAERREDERLEQERLEAERREQERLEEERLEQERLEAERREAERLEAERREDERLEQERLEAQRLEEERHEQERLQAEELARYADHDNRLAASRLLTELSQDLPGDTAAQDDQDQGAEEPEQTPDGSTAAEPGDYLNGVPAELLAGANDYPGDTEESQPAVAPAPPAEMADTAALLRELSSLGGDEPPPTVAPHTAHRPHSRPTLQPEQKKKKRGLFGR